MPLRPFPFQIAIGTDIIHVARIRSILVQDTTKPGHLDRFLKRFLTARERQSFGELRERLGGERVDATSRHLAGRWAAKEAVIKAVSWKRLGFHDIVIQRSNNGSGVFAVILDKVAKKRNIIDSIIDEAIDEEASDGALSTALDVHEYDDDSISGQVARISISHDGDYATAVCLAAEEPMEGDVGGEAAAREPF